MQTESLIWRFMMKFFLALIPMCVVGMASMPVFAEEAKEIELKCGWCISPVEKDGTQKWSLPKNDKSKKRNRLNRCRKQTLLPGDTQWRDKLGAWN